MSTERARIERAKKILNEQPADFPLKDYLEAMVNETLHLYYSDRLKILRMYSDDLPTGVLVGPWHPKYPMMKCRGNVIVGVGGTIQTAVNDGVVKNKDVVAKLKYYRTHDWNYAKGAKGEFWTLPEEINLINNTLDSMVNYIDREYGIEDRTSFLDEKFQELLNHARESF